MTMQTIRTQDKRLTNILYEQLNEYITKPIPEQKLELTLQKIFEEIRSDKRLQKDIIVIDENFYWNKETQKIFYDKKEIHLTKKERAFLALLFSGVHRDFSYEQISLTLWETTESKQDTLKTLVKTLRRKLPRNIIKNIFGYGYTLDFRKM